MHNEPQRTPRTQIQSSIINIDFSFYVRVSTWLSTSCTQCSRLFLSIEPGLGGRGCSQCAHEGIVAWARACVTSTGKMPVLLTAGTAHGTVEYISTISLVAAGGLG